LIGEASVKGLIGFLGFSERQRAGLIERSSLLCSLCQRLDYLLQSDTLGMDEFLRHPKTTEVIDLFEKGVVLTTPDYQVLNANHRARRILEVEHSDVRGEPLFHIAGSTPRDGAAREKGPFFLKDRRTDDYPLSGPSGIGGHVLILAEKLRSKGVIQAIGTLSFPSSMMVGTSKAMIRLRDQVGSVAVGNSTVLLVGETGSGKELAARCIHEMSRRWAKPIETINCAAIPDALFESEIFGYAPGAFTGAWNKGKKGRFAAADGGTVFLDEVGRLSIANQAKILRVLEDRLVQRLGDERRIQIDIRIIAATNTDLGHAVAEGRFLPDLYYRLNIIPILVPALRERREDVPLLIEHFLNILREDLPESGLRGFSKEIRSFFMQYEWPGNIRELKNVVEYLMNLVRGRQAILSDLPPHLEAASRSAPPAHPTPNVLTSLGEAEQKQIKLALETFGTTCAGKRLAAKHLGISLSTLYRKISKAGTGGSFNEI